MVVFGGIGYVMRKTRFPAAPLILAMVLGSIFERSLQQSIIMAAGRPLRFYRETRLRVLSGCAAFLI